MFLMLNFSRWASWLVSRAAPSGSHLDLGHELDALEGLQPLDPALRTIAGFIDTAKGRLGRGNSGMVDADKACFQPLLQRLRLPPIAGEDVRGEPEAQLVRALHDLVERLERRDRGERAERPR